MISQKRAKQDAKLFFLQILLILFLVFTGNITCAEIMVTITGPSGQASQSLPDEGGAFDMDLPLNRNAVNSITVTAEDANGNSASRELSVTQVSLDQIVVSQITAERLSVEEVEQLVADGVIDLEDPQNYNVSTFNIVLTINKQPVSISIPIAVSKNEKPEGGSGGGRLLFFDDDAAGPSSPEIQVVVFDIPIASVPSVPGERAPTIPGVILIEGNIKSLKEFFNVRFLLMNTSGIFTLSDVNAEIALPEGMLSNVLPADGINGFGDILPGTGDQPGQKEKEFIIRGDSIGNHTVAVNFGGTVTGPGISEPIPFNGSAETSVEVKGPPALQVQVSHPETVVAGTPYDLVVEITNTGEVVAMYASLDLSVDADAQIYFCETDQIGDPICGYGDGPAVRSFGHIMPGAKVSETFSLMPGQTGNISSCMAATDQNIDLQVLVGTIGCVVGTFPPEQSTADGNISVSVLPAPNVFGIHEDSPVVAFFSTEMNESSIFSGENGTFNVFTNGDELVPGQIRFETLNQDTDNEKTVAIWQVNDGITNRLASNATYTIVVARDVADLEGNTLSAKYQSEFTTTDTGINDTTPPSISLSVQPPVNPNTILPGQIIRINGYASDQGSGISRVELRLKDMDMSGSLYELIDQKTVFDGDLPPYIFAVDSTSLTAGHIYQAMATAYDGMNNAQNATISLIILESAVAPTVTLPDDLGQQVLHGISITLAPEVTGGVNLVEYYLNDATEPYKTVTLAPWQGSLSTPDMILGDHTIRVLATDGLDQTGEAFYDFELTENINMPVVGFSGLVDGAQYITGDQILVNGTAEDPVGINSMSYYLDENPDPIYSGIAPILLSSAGLALGDHTISLLATNNLGVQNIIGDPASVFEFTIVEVPSGPPPAPPVINSTSYPVNGTVTITGTSVAGTRIDVTNDNLGFMLSFYADTGGNFTAAIAGEDGHTITIVAYDFSSSDQPSDSVTTVITAAPTLLSISVSPAAFVFTEVNEMQEVTVTGHYDDSPIVNVTTQTVFSSSIEDNPGVVAISNNGQITALKAGNAVITVEFGGFQEQLTITANILTMTHISVQPESVLLITTGQTEQLTVTAHYNNNSTAILMNGLSYITGNPQVAAISSSGMITSVTDGTTQVSVSHLDVAPLAVPVIVDTGQDPAPTISLLSPLNGTNVERLESVLVSLQGEDSFGGVTRIFLEVSGGTLHTDNRQISPPALLVTEQFLFPVAADAPVGGTITVRAWAEDSSGNISNIAEIVLNVVDQTSPDVSITQPGQLTPYNYGDTVAIHVEATDAVEISQIRFETSGALIESGLEPVSGTSASADFSFVIPIGTMESDVRIHAWASDIHGNEGTAIPVDIVITDADINSPETIATSVSDPAGSTSAIVTYEVTDGLNDLDYVALYFRRDGHGTFNRYTGADGTESGEFMPQSGNIGTIIFDSTRMGGDGSYDFYTVGVDIAGNHEAAPNDGADTVLPDQTAVFAAGTIWTIISSDTVVEATDTSFDNENIRIDGATVTVTGSHPFHNMELLSGAVLTHKETTTDTEYLFDINTWSLTIDENNSRINVTGRGYIGGSGQDEFGRTQGNIYGSSNGAGGSYGGLGGVYSSAVAGPVYGSLTDPIALGSGGGDWQGTDGGDGGGLITINAINIVVDGNLEANGGESVGSAAGDGSGGTINIITRTLSGSGFITANGGGQNTGTGGGGGRIAVHYLDMATMDISHITASGGDGQYGDGANGTVYLKQDEETNGAIVITGRGPNTPWTHLTIPEGYSFDTVTLSNQARVLADDPIVISGRLLVTGDSILSHSQGNESGLSIDAATIQIDEGSAIDVTGRGYHGGTGDNEHGHTLNDIEGASNGAGGSYGGQGAGYNYADSSIVYGDPKQPDELGSGGGYWQGSDGGDGGGRISLIVDTIIVNGAIRANGGESVGSAAGDGSGGAILISTSQLTGNGTIEANGGGNASGTAGGGGRVAVHCDYVDPVNNLADLYNITTLAGHGQYDDRQASAGTVYIKYSGQDKGNLFIDDKVVDGTGIPNGTASQSTPLPHIGFGTAGVLSDQDLDGTVDTLSTDGLVRMLPGGLTGLRLNPDINQEESFVILSNTDAIITVVTPNENGAQFNDVADGGDTYVGTFSYDNLTFRRGGNLVTGDLLNVTDTMTIDEYGLLTHFNATSTFISWLDLSVDKLVIEETGRIDVTGRGYIGGKGSSDPGQTQGNVDGSSSSAGGSYGGLGAVYHSSAFAGPLYGSLTDPIDLGSGGGAFNTIGGDGGGLIFITADSIIVNGAIRSDGGESAGSAAGDGSGGTVNIITSTLGGSGSIEADGGGQHTGTGGGGGRIAIDYSDSLTLPEADIHTSGGQGQYGSVAGNGTIFLKRPGQLYGEIIIDGQGVTASDNTTFIFGGYSLDNITLRNGAKAIADDGLNVVGRLLVTGDSILSHSQGNESGLSIDAATIQIDEGSAIDVTGRGYPGGTGISNPGHTLGNIEGASASAGGSYGGQGAGYNYADSYIVYGDPKQPDELGSGGGYWQGSDGGDGGGRISLIVDTIIVNGAIRANGGESVGSAAGDGSGGAILISTSQLTGNGTIEANGGGNGYGTAGGGGRVAVYCDYVDPADNLADLYNITAFEGHGQYDDRQGSAGTVYIEYNNQDAGVLYIDDNVADATASQSTPLPHIGFGTAGVLSDQDLDGTVDTLTTDGLVRMLPGGLTGLRLNPDINQEESFVILSNSDSTITVITPNENGVQFTDVADIGDIYAGSFSYNNLTFRRGGNLVTGDPLTITDTMTIDEYGLLTHFNATATFISWLDLSVNNLVIEETGRIDVTARGYIGGKGSSDPGQTQGNVDGSSNGAGGSHGGLGGVYGSGTAGPIYGSLTDPIDLGSGGGHWQGSDGGDGGGVIFITATNMTVNGVIRSNGGESAGSAAGDGSGGTVNIITSTLSGSGSIEADGGGPTTGTGGGGGRIAIYYSDSLTLTITNVHTTGGQGQYGTRGGDGSVHLMQQ